MALIDRDYAIQQIKIAKEKGINFDYESLIDFIKALPKAMIDVKESEVITWQTGYQYLLQNH